MLNIRPAEKRDQPGIQKVLDEADLHYQNEELTDFYVAAEADRIVAIVRLEEHPGFFFLTSLGVLSAYQHRGIATQLLQTVLSAAAKPVYLYTVIPEFFGRQGFAETADHPDLPAKQIFGCDLCEPGRCVVMVRRPA